NEYFSSGAWVVGGRRSCRYVVLFRIFSALEKEIDKRIVFLRSEDDQCEPAKCETSSRLRPGHFMTPIPGLSSKPNNDSCDENRQKVIGLKNKTANQCRIGERLMKVKHRAEILNGAM